MQRFVTVTEFKAKSSFFLNEMETGGGSITITRRGQPVAELRCPAKKKRAEKPWKSLGNILADKGRIIGDIVNLDTADLWECVNESGT